MRRQLPLLLLPLLLGCPPSKTARDAGVAPVVTGVVFADGPRVRDAFPPEVQAALLEGELEALLIACERKPEKDERAIRDYPVVASVTLDDKAKRAELLAQVYQGVEQGKYFAKCFIPHHALRAEHDGHLAEVVICFACVTVEVYLDGKIVAQVETTRQASKAFEALLGPIRDKPGASGGRG